MSLFINSLLAATSDAPQRVGTTFWMPENASTLANSVDPLFYAILWISVFFFVLTMAAALYFVVKYRRKSADQKTSAIAGHPRLEVIWSVIPALILVALFVWGFVGFLDYSVAPPDAMEVRVLGRKWSWEFDYPSQAVTGAAELVVPLGKPVKLIMSSVDVIHSFYVPAFRVKKDVLPNRYTSIWFETTELGTFDVYCTEYCGTGHSVMQTKVKVVTNEEFAAWVKTGGGLANLPPKELGQKLFISKGCVACHSTTADPQGKPCPAFGGRYGKEEELEGGTTVLVDDNYIRESLMTPAAKVVKGYQPVMPTYQGQLDDREINALIEYIKSLAPTPSNSAAAGQEAPSGAGAP